MPKSGSYGKQERKNDAQRSAQIKRADTPEEADRFFLRFFAIDYFLN